MIILWKRVLCPRLVYIGSQACQAYLGLSARGAFSEETMHRRCGRKRPQVENYDREDCHRAYTLRYEGLFPEGWAYYGTVCRGKMIAPSRLDD